MKNLKILLYEGDALIPPDTVTSQQLRSNNKSIYCSVVVGRKGEPRWISGDELKEYLRKNENETDKAGYGINAIKSAIAVFGDENVRAYTGGIPNVWLSGGSVDKDKVEDLLCGIHEVSNV